MYSKATSHTESHDCVILTTCRSLYSITPLIKSGSGEIYTSYCQRDQCRWTDEKSEWSRFMYSQVACALPGNLNPTIETHAEFLLLFYHVAQVRTII